MILINLVKINETSQDTRQVNKIITRTSLAIILKNSLEQSIVYSQCWKQ